VSLPSANNKRMTVVYRHRLWEIDEKKQRWKFLLSVHVCFWNWSAFDKSLQLCTFFQMNYLWKLFSPRSHLKFCPTTTSTSSFCCCLFSSYAEYFFFHFMTFRFSQQLDKERKIAICMLLNSPCECALWRENKIRNFFPFLFRSTSQKLQYGKRVEFVCRSGRRQNDMKKFILIQNSFLCETINKENYKEWKIIFS
jgi:hypothetical protein